MAQVQEHHQAWKKCGLGVGSGVAAVEVGTVEEQHRDSDDCKLDGEQ